MTSSAQSLAESLDYWIDFFNRRRRRNKIVATLTRVTIVILSALVTISLAIDLSDKNGSFTPDTIRLFALICSVAAASLATFEAFVDHKRMWVTNGISLSRVTLLRQRLSALAAYQELSRADIEELLDRLSDITEADARQWGEGRLQSPDVLNQVQSMRKPGRE
jgi:hypothetical protein